MENTKITGNRVRNHFAYSLWKYVLFAILAVVGWNLVYTSTAYRAPKTKRLDLYFVTYSVPEETLDWFRQGALDLIPALEDAACASIIYTPEDNYYGSIQLSTYMGAGEGDLFLMARDRFEANVPSGVFADLTDAIAAGTVDLRGIDLSAETRTDEEGRTGVFGIPAETLYGLYGLQVDARDLVLCVPTYSFNQDRAIEYLNWLIGALQAEKPDWLSQQEAEQTENTPEISEIPSY